MQRRHLVAVLFRLDALHPAQPRGLDAGAGGQVFHERDAVLREADHDAASGESKMP